ncbi:MAG: hypothetical protein JWS12_652 [Candidatus Saccharibacteria bacterium]|nr:hypothetical protein [Candidatus Saccharibacteria bacterium]
MKPALLVGVVVAILAFVIGLYLRRRSMAFEGEVIDKDVREMVNNTNQGQGGLTINMGGNTGNVTHSYMIKVQTSTGKTINWQVSEGKYQQVNIGDHVTKQADTTDIAITPKTPTT